jgi:hypothetical protein
MADPVSLTLVNRRMDELIREYDCMPANTF